MFICRPSLQWTCWHEHLSSPNNLLGARGEGCSAVLDKLSGTWLNKFRAHVYHVSARKKVFKRVSDFENEVCFGQFGFTQAFSVFLPRKKPRQLFTTGLIARIKKYSCCFQMAMIGVCGNVVAQTVSNATKILTAAIVPEVANVPLPSRSVGGGCCCRCWFCFVSLFQTRGFMLVLWKSFSVARDAQFCPSPVIDRSNPPKSDHGDPCHDFCLIKVQCMWSCVRTFLFCFFAVLQTCWSGIAFLVKPVPHLQFVNFPCPAADQKRRWMHLIFLVSLNEPKTSIFFFKSWTCDHSPGQKQVSLSFSLSLPHFFSNPPHPSSHPAPPPPHLPVLSLTHFRPLTNPVFNHQRLISRTPMACLGHWSCCPLSACCGLRRLTC